MSLDRSDLGIPKMPMISPEVASLIPYGLARRLCAIPVAAAATEITVMTARSDDFDTLDQIRSVTGRNVHAIEISLEDFDWLLDHLSGKSDDSELWLQHRHIVALSRLADNGLNRGNLDPIRSLVDRALEFAPYSAELWLTRAKLATHRRDVVEALTIASHISPHDRRIVRWMNSLDEEDRADFQFGSEGDPVWASAPPAPLPFTPPVGVSGDAFQTAREIGAASDLDLVLRTTAETLQSVTSADSVSVYLQGKDRWTGYSTSPDVQPHLSGALPKANRVAAQALKQGLPIVIADTSKRANEVGPIIARSRIRSFALLPVASADGVVGLAYVNFDSVDRAGSVFDPGIANRLDVLLTAAGNRAASALSTPESGIEAVDDLTDTFSPSQFRTMVRAEVERARRYRFSVSLVTLEYRPEGGSLDPSTARELAVALQGVGRTSDVVAHCAINTFAVMLPQTTADGAELVASRLRAAAGGVLDEGGAETSLAVRIATFPDEVGDADELLSGSLGRTQPQSPDHTFLLGSQF